MAAKSSDWQPGPTVCRCCLTEGCYKDISTEYFWMGKREVYSEMLSETFDVTISYALSMGTNSNSRLICEPCISRLRDASDFKRQVLDCERTFLQYLVPQSSSAGEGTTATDQDIKVSSVKLEVKFSDDEEIDTSAPFQDDDDDLDDEPLTKLASKIPKKESVDYMELEDNAKPVKRKSTIKIKASPSKKAKKTKETVKATASKAAATAKPEKKKKGPESDANTTEDREITWKLKRKCDDWRQNARIILECTNVFPFRWQSGRFFCAFCRSNFAQFEELKTHAREHTIKAKNIEILLRSARLQSRMKVEASNLQCEICCQPIDGIDGIRKHLTDMHQKSFLDDHDNGILPFIINGQHFACANCNETFPLFQRLIVHMNTHVPNIVCPKCGKGYSTSLLLQSHLKSHETVKTQKKEKVWRLKCQLCNERFKEHYQKMKHLREVHNFVVEYPCHLCPAKFFAIHNRKDHINRIHIREMKFSCNDCSYKCVDKRALRLHMVRHSGEKAHKCEVCGKVFARNKTLISHLRIHNKDSWLYCEICDYKCAQKCSLKNHMTKHHPEIEFK